MMQAAREVMRRPSLRPKTVQGLRPAEYPASATTRSEPVAERRATDV